MVWWEEGGSWGSWEGGEEVRVVNGRGMGSRREAKVEVEGFRFEEKETEKEKEKEKRKGEGKARVGWRGKRRGRRKVGG